MTKMCHYQPGPMGGSISLETAMSHAIVKLFGEPKSWRSVEACRQRMAMATATLSIAFLAVLIVTL